MYVTNEKLRELYLEDLQHGVDAVTGRRKIRDINEWKAIDQELLEGHAQLPVDWKTVLLQVWRGERDVWVWSDIHFGHKNIIKFCNRPYPNVGMMNQCLEGNYLNVVKPQDIVIWGGDIAFMKRHEVEEILTRLPGYKVMVVGNHDIHHRQLVRYMGFAEYHLCFTMPIEDEGFDLLFTHYPLNEVPEKCFNVHGHIHQHLAGHRNINMCVEHTNYAPKNLKDIIAEAKKRYEKYDQ